MKNPFESLNTLFKTDKVPERRLVRHPKEREIVEHALHNLSLSDHGRDLVDFVHQNALTISVLRGRENRDFTPTHDTAYISVMDGVSVTNPEITINMIAAIRGVAQEHDPMLKKVSYDNGEAIYIQREEKKLSDILQLQAKIVYELGKIANKTEFIDSFTLMGYYSLIDAYEKDLEDKQE